ncbi:MAG TPA: amino acid adenylation domain-containing protein [Candidatus Angelobacter sp.]|jgi:amino acid adenylation domain-containing protein|nr:amino acid adenylation domain-containing protein [Candidatus Angelobacter sp.]
MPKNITVIQDDIVQRRSKVAARRAGLSSAKQAELKKLLKKTSAQESAVTMIARHSHEGPVPLSFGQQRLWFVEQMTPGTPVYNIPVAIRLSGKLNLGALHRALNEVIRRHESLRTNFLEGSGQGVQLIAAGRTIELPVVSLQDLQNPEQHIEACRFAFEYSRLPFDLTKDALLRATILKLGEQEHTLVLVVHHIVSDGWSSQIFIREIGTLYQAFCIGSSSPLPELPIQYADYALWQREQLQGKALESALSYWKEQLRDCPRLLDLPSDRPRPAVMSFRGAAQEIVILKKLADDLRTLSQREGVTLFTTLLASFQLLLSCNSSQDDIAVGTPVAGRPSVETEGLIGLFVNTVVVRARLSDDITLREFLAQAQETVFEAQAHENLPFEKLVEELRPERSLSHSPLFQVMFAFQNVPKTALDVEGLHLTELPLDPGVERFDLTLSASEEKHGLFCSLSYNTDLFDRSTIERMASHWQQVLHTLVAKPDLPISRLSLLTSNERSQLLNTWNATETQYQQLGLAPQLFEEQARNSPLAIAVEFEDRQLTYAELNSQANQLARYLQKAGVGPETLVGVCMERSTELVVSLLAIIKAGAAYVPLDPGNPTDRLAGMVEDVQASVILVQEKTAKILPGSNSKQVIVDAEWPAVIMESSDDLGIHIEPDSLAYVIFTSGSTGRPKGAMNTHRGLKNRLLWMQEAYKLSAADAVLQKTPFSFDVSVWEFFWPLLVGARLVVARPGGHQDPVYLAELIHNKHVTTLHFVPSMLSAFLDSNGAEKSSSLRRIICSGEALAAELAEKCLQQIPAELHNLYGPTEASIDVTRWKCEASGLDHGVAIGKPIANTQVYVLNSELEPVPVGVAGELYLGGIGLARGYLKNGSLTAQKFIPNPFGIEGGQRLYRTGDWAKWRADGNLQFLGRRDGQIKLRGNRIELGEIEAALHGHSGVKNAAVTVNKDTNGEYRLVGYVVPQVGNNVTDVELRKFLQQKLPDYMVPAVYVFLAEFPLSSNGKLDKRNLPEPDAASQAGSEKQFVAPRTVVEEVISSAWAEVLGMEKIGRSDDFFELGGHSLLATRVISRLRQNLQIEVPVRGLFESPTLNAFAELVEAVIRSGASAAAASLRTFVRGETAPLSSAQQRLWFLDQLMPGSSAYNVPAAAQLGSELNLAALEQSLSEVIRRHEALRTTFTKVKGQAVQVIVRPRRLLLPVVDLTSLSEEEQSIEAKRLAQDEALRAFDLATGPLLRTKLLKLKDHHLMLVTMHHIISDGWSMGVFIQEVENLYGTFSQALPSTLAELKFQYADYAEWQKEYLQGEGVAKDLEYWKRQLSGAPTVLELETDYPRPAIRTGGGEPCEVVFSKELSQSLRQFGRREGATMFMTLMAAFQALLARYTGQQNILVGSPIAGRSRVELESLIGFFVNMVVLRADFSEQPTFRELLRQVRESALKAYAHQDLPFDKLVEELQPERSIGRNPLFQVILAFQNVPMPSMQMAGVTLPSGSPGSAETKFDLEVYFWDSPEGITGSFVYSPELFKASTIQRMVAHFQNLLNKALAQPDLKLSEIDILEETESKQIVEEWNQTAIEFPADICMHQLFERQVDLTPDAIAVICGQEKINYRELDRRANLLANYLQKHGVGPEVLVGICLERRVEMIVGLLGILKAGGAYVPLDPEYPTDRLAYIFQDARVPVLLTQESCLEKLPELSAKIVNLDKDWNVIAQESHQPATSGVAAGNLAYVIYTSGSTGQPKGVMIRHSSLCNLVAWHNRKYEITAKDKAIQLASLAFDAATWEIWPYLAAGASLFLPRAKSYEIALELKNWLKENDITICFLSTPLAETVIDDLPSGLALKHLLTGGDRLHKPKKEFPFQFVNHYGPTEITVLATCATVDFASPVPPIGRPISNTQVYLLDTNMQPVPVGATGEIYVGGEGVARGYWQQPELTAEYFVPDPFSTSAASRLYRTGDLGRFLPDGTIEYRGRKDHQVKIRGFRIELGEIESALKQQSEVREAVVLARQDGLGEKCLVAYVVPRSEGAVTSDKLKGELKSHLPEYMVPGVYVFLNELPLTKNGKVDTNALPAPDMSLIRSERTFVPPKDALQEQLVGIWEELLATRPIGVTDDFFELGGHSLLAVQLITRIEERLNKRIPMASLFQAATIENIAQALSEETESPSWSPLVPIRPEGTRKPVYVVHAAGGHLLAYGDIARNWWPDQPLYGLQSRETNKDLTPHTQIEAMAAEYVTAIRAFQLIGPYYLAGWSMGGVIAFEIARQLQQQKQVVAMLAIFDAEAPFEKPVQYNWAVLLGSFVTDLGMSMETVRASWDEIAPLPPMQQLNRLWSLSKKQKLVAADMTLMAFRQLFDAFKMNAQTMRSYVGGPYQGRIDLFSAEKPIEYIGKESPENYESYLEPGKGWDRLAAQGVQIYSVPGQHYTMMQEPHVKTLAEKLRACIDNAAKEF